MLLVHPSGGRLLAEHTSHPLEPWRVKKGSSRARACAAHAGAAFQKMFLAAILCCWATTAWAGNSEPLAGSRGLVVRLPGATADMVGVALLAADGLEPITAPVLTVSLEDPRFTDPLRRDMLSLLRLDPADPAGCPMDLPPLAPLVDQLEEALNFVDLEQAAQLQTRADLALLCDTKVISADLFARLLFHSGLLSWYQHGPANLLWMGAASLAPGRDFTSRLPQEVQDIYRSAQTQAGMLPLVRLRIQTDLAGLQLLIDGANVIGPELLLTAGPHVVQLQTPEGAITAAAKLQLEPTGADSPRMGALGPRAKTLPSTMTDIPTVPGASLLPLSVAEVERMAWALLRNDIGTEALRKALALRMRLEARPWVLLVFPPQGARTAFAMAVLPDGSIRRWPVRVIPVPMGKQVTRGLGALAVLGAGVALGVHWKGYAGYFIDDCMEYPSICVDSDEISRNYRWSAVTGGIAGVAALAALGTSSWTWQWPKQWYPSPKPPALELVHVRFAVFPGEAMLSLQLER